jgi:hypothetical protein
LPIRVGNTTKGENAMLKSSVSSIKIKAKFLQKAKMKTDSCFALKDAFAVISKAAGYASWKEMKDSYDESDIFNPPKWSAQWKIWFASIEDARNNLKPENYLVPYRNQFFICDIDYLKSLGIELDDPNLKKIGNDWSIPKDLHSWEALKRKIQLHHKLISKS